MTRGLVVRAVVALALLAAVVAADQREPPPGWSLRIVWYDSQAKVGAVVTLPAMTFEVRETFEPNNGTAAAARARARAITMGGFGFDEGGVWRHVPAHRVELVEVLAVY